MAETFLAEQWMTGNYGQTHKFQVQSGIHPRDRAGNEKAVCLFVSRGEAYDIYHFEPDQARKLAAALIYAADKEG